MDVCWEDAVRRGDADIVRERRSRTMSASIQIHEIGMGKRP